jgi:hypothetical protein
VPLSQDYKKGAILDRKDAPHLPLPPRHHFHLSCLLVRARRSRLSSRTPCRFRRSSASLEPPSGWGGRGGDPPPDCAPPLPLVPYPSSPATAPFFPSVSRAPRLSRGRRPRRPVPVRYFFYFFSVRCHPLPLLDF